LKFIPAIFVPYLIYHLNWEPLFDQFAEQGFVVVDDFLAASEYQNLQSRLEYLLDIDSLKKAGIGTDANYRIKEGIRGDYISWMTDSDPTEAGFLVSMEEMKGFLNLNLLLSLKSLEFHFASYPSGSFYARHLDQFNERNNRMISFVLYLNDEWIPEHEGCLRIYQAKGEQDVAPIGNRLVLFRSDILQHEVMPTQVVRNSVTGWFLYQPHDLVLLC